MPLGKAAGVRCVQLDAAERCQLFGHPTRPAVCTSLRPHATMCGNDRQEALQWLTTLEAQTTPAPAPNPEAHAAMRSLNVITKLVSTS
jgi:uncharacterized protein